MKKHLALSLFLTLLITSAFTTYHSLTTWTLGDDYEIKFTADEPSGIFKTLEGDIKFDENDLDNSSFKMTVDVNSINTGKGMQNKHAVSDKWFDAKKYPNITFNSSKMEKTETGFSVTGELTIKDVTKSISFPFTFEDSKFKGQFEIDRLDYGIGTMKGMQGNASQKLLVELSVPVTK